MNTHILIATAVLGVILAQWAWQAWRMRRRELRSSAGAWVSPDTPYAERHSPSGRTKVEVYPHAAGVLRLEVFRWIDDEPTEPYWLRVSGPSFVDATSMPGVMDEALRAASGETL